jgi:cytochrome c oxidase subunit IV
MTGHVMPVRAYLAVFGALLVLTFVTVWVARYDLDVFNIIVALSVAIAKGLLVLLYFMHLRYSGRLVWICMVAAFSWLGLLLGALLHEMATRDWTGMPTPWE